MNPFKIFILTLCSTKNNKMSNKDILPIYDIKIDSLQGKAINLYDFSNKFILFVNVASKCGFTTQYADLEKLNNTYKEKLVVIGVPCNQFGSQEPGSADEIEQFCHANYGVTFLMTEKIDVKGGSQHPLYTWLTDKTMNGFKSSTVRWNFQKYLVNPEGELIDYHYSVTKPLSSKITKHLK